MACVRKRVRPNGTHYYQAIVRLKGHPPESAPFDRKSDANIWAATREREIKEGRHGSSSSVASGKRTAAEMIDRFASEVLPNHPKRKRDISSHLKVWKGLIGQYSLSQLSPSVIAQARDRLLTTPSSRTRRRPAPATVLRIMASLAAVLKVAVREWQWIAESPMSKVDKPRASRGRVRYLTDEERQRLLSACRASGHPYLTTIVLLAISTGMRLGEIMKLRWELIDTAEDKLVGHAILLQTKNGEDRRVPIAGAALTAVRGLTRPANNQGLLFASVRVKGEKPMEIRSAWLEVIRKAGIRDFRFHDLRHTAASYLAMNGATAPEIAAVLGHKTLAMVKRYAHLSDSHTSSVVASMNAAFIDAEVRHGD